MAEKKIKKWHWVILFLIIFFAIGLKFYQNKFPDTFIDLKGERLNILIANTVYQQYKGLGGRDSLGEYDGMIFLYSLPVKPVMVMRDMNFSIDVVWFLDGGVVDIAPSLPVELDKDKSELTKYYPRSQANAVLELPAGWTKAHNLKIGDKMVLVED